MPWNSSYIPLPRSDMKKPVSAQKTAVIYARYSCHNQKEESIEQQIEACTKYAIANGYQITGTYADKAITGKRETRAAFQRLIRDAERREFNTVIAYKSNRIARNMLNALQFEAKMDSFGISTLYAAEEFGDNAAGRFAMRMMMNVNQFYSENMAEDILRGMRDNAMNCKVNSGALPLGYRKGADGKYEIDPEEAEIVREIFTKVSEGMLYVEIANELNSRGIKTKYDGLWNKNSFRKMLSNERYLGVYVWRDVRIDNGVPQIIEKELFDTVQEKINTKSTRGRHERDGEYILTGKLICGKCGSLMTGVSGTGINGAKYHYYACRKRNDPNCDKRYVPRKELEQAVVHAVMDYLFDSETIDWMVDCCMEYQKNTFENQQLVANQQRVKDINAELEHIVNAICKGVFSDTTQEKLLALEAERGQLEQEIEEQTHNLRPFTEDMYRFYFESFRNGDVDNPSFRKKLVRQFVDAIYLFDDEFRITFSGNGESANVPLETVKNAETLADSAFDLAPLNATKKESGAYAIVRPVSII